MERHNGAARSSNQGDDGLLGQQGRTIEEAVLSAVVQYVLFFEAICVSCVYVRIHLIIRHMCSLSLYIYIIYMHIYIYMYVYVCTYVYKYMCVSVS